MLYVLKYVKRNHKKNVEICSSKHYEDITICIENRKAKLTILQKYWNKKNVNSSWKVPLKNIVPHLTQIIITWISYFTKYRLFGSVEYKCIVILNI